MNIRYIIVHCTATAAGRDFHVADVRRWHKARGWNDIGYHYLIALDGTIEPGRSETQVGAHCAGLNSCSLGVCYVGGLATDGRTPADTRTTAQKAALRALLARLKKKYPNARILAHHHFNKAKACPCFDADHEYEDL